MVHWWEDRYGNPDWPLLGKYVVQPNIEHHSNQTAFTTGDYWTRNWTVLAPSLTAAAVAAAVGQWWLALVAVIVSQGNLIIATAKIFVRENQIEGLGVIFDEMEFVGIKKGEAA